MHGNPLYISPPPPIYNIQLAPPYSSTHHYPIPLTAAPHCCPSLLPLPQSPTAAPTNPTHD